jgi:UDP-xylose:glucoside alpha-1,3-xylosyltransferase
MSIARKMNKRASVFVSVLVISYFVIFKLNHQNVKETAENKVVSAETVISIVACGKMRANQAVNSVKSALLFSAESDRLKFIIFSDTKRGLIEKELKIFQNFRNFSYVFHNASFPEQDNKMWAKLFKPCAAQRLFFPNMLTDVDALLYIDADTLFVSPPIELYRMFNNFTEHQIAGLAPEAMENSSCYSKNAKIPFYGKFGLNSGVKLMNLTRMRSLKYQEKLLEFFWKYKKDLRYFDQDIMNIYFHDNPEQLFDIPCEYNYRTDFCEPKSTCAAEDGIKLIHGNRKKFKLEYRNLIFSQIFGALEKLQPVSYC